MKLSVIIPCYNEIETIGETIKLVLESPIENKEIVIVDDHSKDGTVKFLKSLDNENIKLAFHERNKGKGAALRTGFELATGDIFIIQDADLEYEPINYENVITPIIEDKADVVFGSRFKGGKPHRVLYFWHMVGNMVITLLSNMLSDLNLSDVEACHKAFKREVIESIELRENRFGFEPEIVAKVAKKRLRIYEVGISYHARTYAEGKKIGWKDGVRAIYCIFRYNIF
tara:strand:+ start:748 stop:1431 length:684 start_codon:yes stop_codon:yes gene_type:complete